MLLMAEEAEGYAGLSAAEQELDKILEANLLGAGRVAPQRSPRIKRFALEDDLAGAGSTTGGDNSGDAGLTMIAEHGNVASWGKDQSQWSPEQQAWYTEAKQWGRYYDADGNWVPLN